MRRGRDGNGRVCGTIVEEDRAIRTKGTLRKERKGGNKVKPTSNLIKGLSKGEKLKTDKAEKKNRKQIKAKEKNRN